MPEMETHIDVSITFGGAAETSPLRTSLLFAEAHLQAFNVASAASIFSTGGYMAKSSTFQGRRVSMQA